MTESAIRYIKTIYTLRMRKEDVRSIDIARELHVTKPSVSIAMANLRKEEMIEMKKTGEIILTEKGEKTAENIYERHVVLSDFLKKIAGVDEATAASDADRIGHFVSQSTFDGIKRFILRYPSLP